VLRQLPTQDECVRIAKNRAQRNCEDRRTQDDEGEDGGDGPEKLACVGLRQTVLFKRCVERHQRGD
jgi:hypothetical protein